VSTRIKCQTEAPNKVDADSDPTNEINEPPRCTDNQMVRYEMSVDQLIMCVYRFVLAYGCQPKPYCTMQNRLFYPSQTR